jgi:hypothetical protein
MYMHVPASRTHVAAALQHHSDYAARAPTQPPDPLRPAPGPQGLKALEPYPSRRSSVEVLPGDLARLEPCQLLNDSCIDFYVK